MILLHLQFVLLESCLEAYARHMLFLKLLTETPEQLGLHGMAVKCTDDEGSVLIVRVV